MRINFHSFSACFSDVPVAAEVASSTATEFDAATVGADDDADDDEFAATAGLNAYFKSMCFS